MTIIEIKEPGEYETVVNREQGQWGLWSVAKGCFVVSMHRWSDPAAVEILPEESEAKP